MPALARVLIVYWGSMTCLSLCALICRHSLAAFLAPRMRFWRNRPDPERLYTLSVLAVGAVVLLVSTTALYFEVVVMPRLDALWASISLHLAQATCRQPI